MCLLVVSWVSMVVFVLCLLCWCRVISGLCRLRWCSSVLFWCVFL